MRHRSLSSVTLEGDQVNIDGFQNYVKLNSRIQSESTTHNFRR